MRSFKTTLFLFLAAVVCAQADELPCYSGIVDLPGQPHSWTAEAYADFDLLLGRLGSNQPLDPSSVRVKIADGDLLPTSFMPVKDGSGQGMVSWCVPAASKGVTNLTFQIYFAPRAATAWKNSQPQSVDAPNMLPNGTFDRDEKLGMWPLRPANPQFVQTVENEKAAHSGRRCIRMLPQPAKSVPFQCEIGSLQVRVEPARKYLLSFWFRSDNVGLTSKLASVAVVYWYRADGSYIRHDGALVDSIGVPQWTRHSATIEAPADAWLAAVFIDFYGATGAFYVDDLTFTSLSLAQVAAARSTDGSKKAQAFMEGDGVRRFDFGPAESVTWPGFVAITPESAYNAKRGFGWIGANLPRAVDRSLPDALGRDYVTLETAFRLAVDLPDGEYIAWILQGDSGFGAKVLPKFTHWRIACNDKTLDSHSADAKTWYDSVMFRHFNEWWQPGVDVYDRFIASQFVEHRFPITVQGGQAKFEFENLPLCALVVAPISRSKELDRELDSVRTARKAMTTIRFNPSPKEEPQGLTTRDRKRGCVVFSRDTAEMILPNSAPRAEERVDHIESFASPGEYEPLTFTIHPLRDIGDVHVAVSDLRSSWSRKIPSSEIEVGIERYMENRLNDGGYDYQVLPLVIQHRDPMPMHGDMTVRWRLRVHVPDTTAPGEYTGTVRIAPSKAPAFTLPIQLRVLPIHLEPVPTIAGLNHFDYVYWYTHFWQRVFGDDPWLRVRVIEHERQNMQMLQRYGINSLSLTGEDLRNEARYEGDKLVIRNDGPFSQWMDVYASTGMKATPWYGFESVGSTCLPFGNYGRKVAQFSPEWERDLVGVANWVKQQEKARGWPDVILYTSDELSNDGAAGAERGVKILQTINRGRGDRPWRTIASVDGPFERILVPFLSIIMPNHAYPITEESLAEIRRQNVELWAYNIGSSRAMWGFYLWRIGAKGRFQWFNCQINGDPWSAFDMDSPYTITRTTPGEPLPSPALYEISEGLDDLRYIATLEKLIVQAGRSSNPKARETAAEAQAELDSLKKTIPANARVLIGEIEAWSAGAAATGDWASHTRTNKQRLRIAEWIVKIQETLSK